MLLIGLVIGAFYPNPVWADMWVLKFRGHPFMTSTKNIPFLTPHPLSTGGRHEIHTGLLKRLVQWPTGPKAEIRLYDCNLSKTVLFVIYITNLYRWQIFTLNSVQSRNSGLKKYTNFFAWEEGWYQWTLILIFCPHGGLTPSTRPHASTWALPPSVWTS